MPREEHHDDISLWIANEESFYNDVQGMYGKWVEEGDSWSEIAARAEANALVRHIAEAIEASQRYAFPYTAKEINEAVDQVIGDFDDYRDESIENSVTEAQRKPKPEDLVMDSGDIEYAKQMEALLGRLSELGYDVEMLRGYMPVSAQKIRQALERGDKHLNSISLRKWDEQAKMLGRPFVGFSLSDGVDILKHVAKWHYA